MHFVYPAPGNCRSSTDENAQIRISKGRGIFLCDLDSVPFHGVPVRRGRAACLRTGLFPTAAGDAAFAVSHVLLRT